MKPKDYVTRVEYENAKEVIARYEAQQARFFHSVTKDYERLIYLLRRDIKSMPKKERLISSRLLNALLANEPCSIKDFPEEIFMSMNRAGVGTWNQFCKYRQILSETDEDTFENG